MTCFDALIGLKGYCDSPTSGLFLNQLGINREELDRMVNDDYDNGSAFFQDKTDIALAWAKSTINARFQDNYQTQSVIQNAVAGLRQQDKKSKAAETGYYVGLSLQLCDKRDYYKVEVSKIELFVNTTANVDVFVYDLVQNKLLDTITVECTAGEVSSAEVNKTYTSDGNTLNLLFAYDSDFASFNTQLADGGCTTCGTNMSLNYRGVVDVYMKKIASGADKINSNLRGLSHSGGMTIDFNVNCDHESWICNKKNLLALGILYKVAAEIQEYKLYNSRRLNHVMLEGDQDQIEALIEKYNTRADEELEKTLANMSVPQTQCFQCRRRSRHVTSLP